MHRLSHTLLWTLAAGSLAVAIAFVLMMSY